MVLAAAIHARGCVAFSKWTPNPPSSARSTRWRRKARSAVTWWPKRSKTWAWIRKKFSRRLSEGLVELLALRGVRAAHFSGGANGAPAPIPRVSFTDQLLKIYSGAELHSCASRAGLPIEPFQVLPAPAMDALLLS